MQIAEFCAPNRSKAAETQKVLLGGKVVKLDENGEAATFMSEVRRGKACQRDTAAPSCHILYLLNVNLRGKGGEEIDAVGGTKQYAGCIEGPVGATFVAKPTPMTWGARG